MHNYLEDHVNDNFILPFCTNAKKLADFINISRLIINKKSMPLSARLWPWPPWAHGTSRLQKRKQTKIIAI